MNKVVPHKTLFSRKQGTQEIYTCLVKCTPGLQDTQHSSAHLMPRAVTPSQKCVHSSCRHAYLNTHRTGVVCLTSRLCAHLLTLPCTRTCASQHAQTGKNCLRSSRGLQMPHASTCTQLSQHALGRHSRTDNMRVHSNFMRQAILRRHRTFYTSHMHLSKSECVEAHVDAFKRTEELFHGIREAYAFAQISCEDTKRSGTAWPTKAA